MGNAGFRLELIGYRTHETVLLKISDLPFIWTFVQRPPDAPFLDPLFKFSTTNESSLVKKLGEELYAAKGESTAYVQIMLCYNKTTKKITDNRLPHPTTTNSTTENEEIDVNNIVRKKITDDLNGIEIVRYASETALYVL